MRHLATAIATVLLLAGCVGETVETTTTVALETTTTSVSTTLPEVTTLPETTTTLPTVTEEFPVYFFFDGFPVEPGPYLAPVARSGAAEIEDALSTLIAGPTDTEREMGLSSPIPEGTRLLGVEVAGGVASVDLSAEFESGGGSLSVLGRVAQIVYTATWFDDVDAVEFLIEGVAVEVLTGEGLIVDRPQTRTDYVDLLPAVFVDAPYWGSAVASPFALSGLAIADSGQIRYVVVDADGVIVAEGDLTTAPGERGEIAASIEIPDLPHPGLGSIIVFEVAPDGTQRHVVEYPLTITD